MLINHTFMKSQVTCFHVHSKRELSSKWAFPAHLFQKPLLVKTSSLLASKIAHNFAEISPYKARIHPTRTKHAVQKPTMFEHGNRLNVLWYFFKRYVSCVTGR